MIQDLKWPSLQQRRKDLRLSFLHKIITDKVAVPPDLLQHNERKQRHQNILAFRHIYANTNVYKNSFFPRSITDWNPLPNSIISQQTAEDFKNALTTFRQQS